MNKLWVAFVAVSSLGLAVMILMASVATEPVGELLFGPVIFFVGWLIVSGVIWLAVQSATSLLASKYPSRGAGLSVAAALALGAGFQSLMFYLPYASAALAWEPESASLAFLIQVVLFTGVTMLVAGTLLTLFSMLRSVRDPRLLN
jgi:hypothetical protein